MLSPRANTPTQVRLGPDLVSVAFALSDELNLNEFNAAVHIWYARSRAALRLDHDVVAAAKQLAALRRTHALLYLQDVLRAGLLTPRELPPPEHLFLGSLLRERDVMIARHAVFDNVAARLRTACKAQQ